VRGSVFFDVGSVSEDAWSFDGDVNSDVGVGLRLDFIPALGPINLYFGVPIQSDEFNDSDGKFSFRMGHAF
jgi:outer membrane protein insertion porin family